MKRFISAAVLAFMFCQAAAQNAGPEAAIEGFFDGLSQLSESKMKEYTTKDFVLLENGAVWNLDTLVLKISPLKNMNLKRVNSFTFISSEQKGDVAWVSYYNKAEFTANEKHQTRNWVESAVLVKEADKWKIQLLHSTRKEEH